MTVFYSSGKRIGDSSIKLVQLLVLLSSCRLPRVDGNRTDARTLRVSLDASLYVTLQGRHDSHIFHCIPRSSTILISHAYHQVEASQVRLNDLRPHSQPGTLQGADGWQKVAPATSNPHRNLHKFSLQCALDLFLQPNPSVNLCVSASASNILGSYLRFGYLYITAMNSILIFTNS